MDKQSIDRLIQEFRGVGLTETDARRSAFCALVYHEGWSAARVGRYLGVSRARIGQRIDRLRKYVDASDGAMPILAQLLQTASPTEPPGTLDPPIGFQSEAWNDTAFAMGLLYQLAT